MNLARHVVALIAIAFLAGCSFSSSDAASDGTMSKEEFVSKADSICAEYNEKFAKFKEVHTFKALARQTDQASDLYQGQLERLRNLEPPANLRDTYEKYLRTSEDRIEVIRQAHEAAEQRDKLEVASHFESGQQVAAREQQLAQQLGLKECSFPPPPTEAEKGNHEHPPGTPDNHEH